MQAPKSTIYNDVYWTGGATEKDHTFFHGNQIPTRIAASNLTLTELGFGTGLNAALACHYASLAPHTHLTFISYELHPLPLPELTTIHQQLPGHLHPYLKTIQTLWPQLQPGWNVHTLTPNTTLRLYLGDALTGLPTQTRKTDAWLLDGFNPAKNPALWSPEIMNWISTHSHPQTTLATYSVARAVRDSLTTAGFTVTKVLGHPPKREILTGTYTGLSDRI